jgi:hypothetical protein
LAERRAEVHGRALVERLIHPHSVDDFTARTWERGHLHIPRAQNPVLADWFEELMSIDDVDRLLTTVYAAGPRRWDSLRMGRDAELIPPERFLTNFDGAFAEVDVDRVLDLHRAGASIILNGVDALLEPVAELCAAVRGALGVKAHANAYITPREAQGFPLHLDTHDVFLLQVVGEKQWRLHDSPFPLATPAFKGEEHAGPLGPATEISLGAGELLYIPRGMLHEGVTSTAMSIHLTIGMHPYTWAELLRDRVAELEREEVGFRRAVRVGEGADESLAELMARLGDGTRMSALAARRLDELRGAQHASPRGGFAQIHAADAVSLDTPVRLRERLRPEFDRRDGERVIVSFNGTALTLPAFAAAHVEELCGGEPVRGADLPPSLDDAGKLVLVRRLVREGLLVPA